MVRGCITKIIQTVPIGLYYILSPKGFQNYSKKVLKYLYYILSPKSLFYSYKNLGTVVKLVNVYGQRMDG